jgi:hypothetical protein
MGTRADFAIARALCESATTCAPAAAAAAPHVGCKEVQYHCDYLHPCSIFTINVISARTLSSPFAAHLARAGDVRRGFQEKARLPQGFQNPQQTEVNPQVLQLSAHC